MSKAKNTSSRAASAVEETTNTSGREPTEPETTGDSFGAGHGALYTDKNGNQWPSIVSAYDADTDQAHLVAFSTAGATPHLNVPRGEPGTANTWSA